MLEVIGITGPKGSGKTTFADAIIRAASHYGRSGVRYSFAKPLKEVCHILFGGTEGNWYGDYKTEVMHYWGDMLGPMYATPRRIMQTVGTEIFRDHVDQRFWLMVAQRYIDDIFHNEEPDFIIIDDVRFDNEAKFIYDTYISGAVIGVTRPEIDFTAEHRSERGVDPALVTSKFTCSNLKDVAKNADAFVHERWQPIKVKHK